MKKYIAIFLLLLVTVFGKLNYINAVEEYKILDPKYNIKPNHEFTIRLSQELDESSLKEGTVRIYDRSTLKAIDIVVRRDTYDAKIIRVKGKNNFEEGKTYTIEVKDLVSKKNNVFKQVIKMDFTVRNKYSGLPAENGLIIVDDKAYAIDYLRNNIRMVNEIITKSYDIYYTYDMNYEKIYSLFKSGPVYGDNSDKRYNQMHYIDPEGRSHLYQWVEDRQEYQLVEPKAKVEVLVRSDAKTINVLSVSAVPDGKYYKVKGSTALRNFGEPIVYLGTDSTEEISILSQDQHVLAKGTVSVNRSSSGEVKLKLSDSLNLGNTAGNINNNGIAVDGYDGYIYYVNNSDKEKLYKQSVGGFFNRVILEPKSQYVNQSGDWIYYSNYKDGGKLYKVKKDGTENQVLVDDKAAYITISGEYVYYSNHSEGGKLYKVKKDGSDAKVWTDNSKHGNPFMVNYGNNKIVDEVAYINIVGDWIYYSNYSDGHRPYVVHKNGTYRGKLSDNFADSVQVEGDWVYFTSGSGVISKINKSGNGSVIPIKGTASEFNKGYHINVYGDWVFYSNAQDDGKLYKINTDGSGNKVKLADETVGYINIVDDWVYFITKQNKLFRIPASSNGEITPEGMGEIKDQSKVVQVDDINIIVDYEDVNQTTEWIEKKYLPQKVAAIMGDNTIQQLVVVWDTDPSKVVVKGGKRSYKGTLVGYNKIINLTLTIPSEMLNDTNEIIVYKNGGRNDMIIVDGNVEPTIDKNKPRIKLGEGDIINVYADYEKKILLGTGKVGRDGRATVSKLDLDQSGRSFYVTVARVKKDESVPTEVRQYTVPVLNSEEVQDKDFIGFGVDIRDITLNNWITAKTNPFEKNYLDNYFALLSQEIYIVPSKSPLDMSKNSPIVKDLPMDRKYWYGHELSRDEAVYKNKDSQGGILRASKYDLFVAANFTGKGSPDIEKRNPLVSGKIVNGLAANLNIVEEILPAKPTIKVQRVQGSGNNLPNDSVNLDKLLLPGQEAWLVPVALVNEVKGWKAEMGSSPFERLLAEGEDLVKYTGSGLIMDSPRGDQRPVRPVDRDYKLFIVNSVGASVESDNRIIVDNSPPIIAIDKLEVPTVYLVGDPISVKSTEKGRIYIVRDVGDGIDLNPTALEEAVRAQNAIVMTHGGGNISVPIFNSEKLIDFAITVGTTITIPHKIIAIDEAGNVSEQVDILVRRYFDALIDKLDAARGVPFPSPELSAAIKKAEALLIKSSVKQAEIQLMYDELTARLGNVGNDTTLSSRDPNIIIEDQLVLVSQITVADLKSKLVTKSGSKINIYDGGTEVINGNINNNYVVRVTAENGYYTDYVIKIAIARPKDSGELLIALNNPEIKIIRLSSGKYVLNSSVIIDRDLKIEGSTFGSEIEMGESGQINIAHGRKLELIKINFTGSSVRSIDAIVSSGELIITGCNFSKIKFNDGIDLAVIKSLSGAKLDISNGTKFYDIKSVDTPFSFISIDEAGSGTKIDNSFFVGSITGKNVKGIKISGRSSIPNEVFIAKNSFTGFASNVHNSMSMPIYVSSGLVNLSGNTINTSESGVFLEAKGGVKVEFSTIGVDNASEVGARIATTNSRIVGNTFGDIIIGETRDGQPPIIHYNSSSTPIIGNIDIVDNLLMINQEPAAGNKFKFKESDSTKSAPRVGTTLADSASYKTYGTGDGETTTIDRTKGNYLIVAEVDKSNKVVKYRLMFIP